LEEDVDSNVKAILAADEKAQSALNANQELNENLALETTKRSEEDEKLLSLINLNVGKIVAIDDKIGELPENKTVVEMINDV
jgi:predicted negative regulator of RcsB-dependent stress response